MSKVDPVRDRLTQLANGVRGWTLTSGLLSLAAAVIWFSLLFVVTDLLLQLPTFWCWVSFLLLVLGAIGTIAFIVRQVRCRMSAESISTLIERAVPGLRNQLINVVQFALSDQPGEAELAEMILAERPVSLDHLHSRRLFPRVWLLYPLVLFGCGALVSLLVFAASQQGYTTSLKRLLAPMAGVPPYTLTQIAKVEPGDTAVVRGNALSISASFEGVLPTKPVVEIDIDKLPSRRLPMESEAGGDGRFSVRTPSLFRNARYRIRGGDARSEWYTIRVDSLPALKQWKLEATPPSYTGLKPLALDMDTEAGEVPWGSTIKLTGESSQDLASTALLQDQEEIAVQTIAGRREFSITGSLKTGVAPTVRLTSGAGLEARISLPVAITPDQSPTVDFLFRDRRLRAGRTDTLPVEFICTDNYGVRAVALEHILGPRQFAAVGIAKPAGKHQRQFNGRFLVKMDTFKVKPGSRLRFRLTAVDFGPDAIRRQGVSRTIEVYVPLPQERRQETDLLSDKAKRTIRDLIVLQQKNLEQSREWEARLSRRTPFPKEAREALLITQTKVTELAKTLLGTGKILGDLQGPVRGLIENEMAQAVLAFKALVRAPDQEQAAHLAAGIKLETRILAVLRGMPKALEFERGYQEKADLLSSLRKIVVLQGRNLVATKKARTNGSKGEALAALVDAEDDVADRTSTFIEEARAQAKSKTDDFGEQLKLVVNLMDGKHEVYEMMVTAAAQLEEVDYPAAIQSQEEVMKILIECLNIMDEWRVKKARETVEKARETLKEIKEKLTELEAKQTKIAEVTRDLAKRDKTDQEVKDELAKMDEEQEEMKADIEKMAQDLYQFPELPIANELNSKMREIYEDVEQAANSENEPTMEIAVQKEDSLLEAIKNTKERVEDVEMWMPDKPDNVKWDMESFDAEEFPEIPLVDLPEELEDIVGELLEQSEEIDAESQDSTGNNIVADAEMGWDIADGPMPSFAAKGKSGNAKPNDNEMTGRSGAGREGQSNGELVENQVKGLEGRETHARRTEDPFQKGQVEESEDSTMDAKATGGGKLGGESESIGMFGNAPRRDLHMQGEKMKKLRQETEALYASSRMLYMGNTANVGAAAAELRRVERVDKNMRDLSIAQRVVRRLADSHAAVSSGAVLNMPVSTTRNAGGKAATDDVDLDKIDDRYRSMVSDYYKSLGE